MVAVAGGLGLRETLRGVAIPLNIRDWPGEFPATFTGDAAAAGAITLISPSSYILRLLYAAPAGDAGVDGDSERAETADARTEGTDCSTGSCACARDMWCGSVFLRGELWNEIGSMSRSNIALDEE
jgi:hypothetical protein